MSSIRFQSVHKILGDRQVLQDLSLEVGPGERVAILGPSGCGKTTLLRLAAGLIAPDQGRIEINGIPVAEDGRNLIEPEDRQVGMVFQDLALWPHLTVSGNLAFGLKVKGTPKQERLSRIHEMLQLVHMESRAHARPAQLSGGEQQRVALARALVLQPKILVMDEPLSSLDEDLRAELRSEILKWHREIGFTLLYVTHDRGEASTMGQRILTMKNGSIQ
ncbi:MAG: ABC transporter ATP-binding protein [Planctomycetes bacterium]|nr:ABC transporter ATP-binding protein [Planctomycetota bacterium]